MENNTAELEQVKRERDAYKAQLDDMCGDVIKCVDIERERDEAVATAAGLREALEKWKEFMSQPIDGGVRGGVALMNDANNAMNAALSTPPSAHLERIQREAAAKELEEISEWIQSVSPDDARDDIRRACKNRAAELRSGGGK